ncbi:MAG: endopeptidase La [Planctomycetes bacterium]|nr:endopeptidase La [Planctomycetota bacterium]
MTENDAANATLESVRPPIPDELPILPLRDLVMFPGTAAPLAVGRASSMKMLDESLPQNKIIGLAAQLDPQTEEPHFEQLHPVGVAAVVLKLVRSPNDQATVLVHALGRIKLVSPVQKTPYLRAKVSVLDDVTTQGRGAEAAFKALRTTANELIALSPDLPEQVSMVIANLETPGQLADFLAANLDVNTEQKQDLLEELDVAKRVRAVQVLLSRQVEIARLQAKIHQDVASTITDTQRKAYLREQMKAIRKELGEDEDGSAQQLTELREKIERAKPPEIVMKEVDRDLHRLEAMHPANPEHSMLVTYLETIADLPWSKLSEDQLDLDRARKILDRDHYDLDKVKRRLIEYLAVRKLNPTGRGPILCLVGPPGVGKTSLGESIAHALGRQFVRMSLGGVRDEAEMRGHRRTYIGAMPGRIIQEMRRAGTRNPVLMLDEIDKLGADFRGDPASALLEILDPRQNHTFTDHYLDLPFDLSQVIFIATANYMDPVPPALRDRMEVIEVPGYTDKEKLQIARRYLVPRQMKENGLKKSQCSIALPALRRIIDAYTREAGVRTLERQIGAVCRGVAAKVAGGKAKGRLSVGVEDVTELLGPAMFEREIAQRVASPGVVTGLAWTPTGGDVLFIEATRFAGKGHFQLTGQLGDVMKESAHTALSLLKSRADKLGIDAKAMTETDVHVHVPAGAVPKDGPSAGVAMYTAMASLMTGRTCRANVAMTGEITLRGLVLPIGGVKEKTLAAMRAGIRTVILPERNRKDLPDVTDEAKKKLKFIFAKTVDDVLEAALLPGKMRK